MGNPNGEYFLLRTTFLRFILRKMFSNKIPDSHCVKCFRFTPVFLYFVCVFCSMCVDRFLLPSNCGTYLSIDVGNPNSE